MDTFKGGDVVQLKSGGPRMTVKVLYDEGHTIEAVYIDGNGIHTIQIPSWCLETVAMYPPAKQHELISVPSDPAKRKYTKRIKEDDEGK